MTPQILVVKIQSLLSGDTERLDARSLAHEYFRQCSAASQRLEHCVWLIKSSRDYAAIQVAEAQPQLLDCLNALSFKELPVWRSFCEKKMLPVARPFDAAQIKLVQALYSKGITQTHPLYRDYRRAVRTRRLDEALSVMRSISRINSFDGEAKHEYARLCERLVKIRMGELSEAINEGNEDRIIEICSSLDYFPEYLENDATWQKASAMRDSLEKKKDAAVCAKILADLRTNSDSDMDEVSQKVSEFKLLKDLRELPFEKIDLDFIDSLSKKVLEYEKKKNEEEIALRARRELFSELELVDAKSGIYARLKKIKRLLSECGNFAEDELALRAKTAISSLRTRFIISSGIRIAALVFCVVAICHVGYLLHEDYKFSHQLRECALRLREINSEQSFIKRSEMLSAFEQAYAKHLQNPSVRKHIESINERNLKEGKVYDRINKGVLELEKNVLKTLSSKSLEDALGKLKYLSSETDKMEDSMMGFELKERLSSLEQKLNSSIEERKSSVRRSIREGLDAYDALVAEYGDVSKPLEETDRKLGKIMEVLRPQIENISGVFAAHKLDIERYNEISAQIAVARKSAQELGAVLRVMKNSRNSTDYYTALETLSQLQFVDQKAVDAAANALKMKVSLGNAGIGAFTELSDISGVEKMSGLQTSATIFSNKILTDIYIYSLSSKPKVFTVGKAIEKVVNWKIGSETSQEVQEIFLGGKVMKNIYKLTLINNKAPKGELLAGGALSEESAVAREAAKIASRKSVLASVSFIANSKAHPLFKAYMEKLAFAFMEKNKMESGLGLSKELVKRNEKIAEFARGVAEYSWMFDSSDKIREIEESLYSSKVPDYSIEAIENLKKLKSLKVFPNFFVGYADINGEPEMFDKASGVFWAVSSSGEVKMFSSKNELSNLAPFTPIMKENRNKK